MDSSDTKDLETTTRDWKYQYHQQEHDNHPRRAFYENSSLLAQLVERSAFKHCSQGTEMSGVRAPYEEFLFFRICNNHHNIHWPGMLGLVHSVK